MAKVTNEFPDFETAISSLPEPLRDKPYITIYKFYEDKYQHAGEKVFKHAGLQVLSPFAPKLEYKGDRKRISINMILFGNSGSNKTGFVKEIMNIVPEGMYDMVQDQTKNGLQDAVAGRDEGIELVVNDMSTVMNDQKLLKTYETAIADGFIKRDNANETVEDMDIKAAMVGACVPDDVDGKIYGGLLFRIVPIEISYSLDEQEDIGENIIQGMNEAGMDNLSRSDIKVLYDTLYNAIKGHWKDHPRIVGYEFAEEHGEEVLQGWKEAIRKLPKFTEEMNFFRQLYDGLRYAALHSLLNLHNRELVDANHPQYENAARVKLEKIDAVVGKVAMQNELDNLHGMLDEDQIKKRMEKVNNFKSEGQYSMETI